MNETHVKIIESWEERVKAQHLTHPDDMKSPSHGASEHEWDRYEREQDENPYNMQQLEYFMGANIALHHAGLQPFPDMFLVILSVGRKASDFKPKG